MVGTGNDLGEVASCIRITKIIALQFIFAG